MVDVDIEAEKRIWQQSAVEKGVVLECVDWANREDMNELYALLSVTGVGPKSRLRAFIKSLQNKALLQKEHEAHEPLGKKRERHVAYVYYVGAIVKGARQSKGARGNVYKFLQRHHAYYSKKDGIRIEYKGNDLTVNAYFRDISHACDFQNALHEWEIHKELANLDGVDVNPSTPEETEITSDLERILQLHYDPGESESPCQTIADLRSYHLSIPVTEPVDPRDPIAKYQSIDKIPIGLKQYKCHLHDKAKNKQLQNNENNMIAASWSFHQFLDGLNTDEGIPLAVLSVKSKSTVRDVTNDNRFQIILRVEFYAEQYSTMYQAPMGARLIDGVWETSVYVKDKDLFAECVGWKEKDTRRRWKEHREWLEGT